MQTFSSIPIGRKFSYYGTIYTKISSNTARDQHGREVFENRIKVKGCRDGIDC